MRIIDHELKFKRGEDTTTIMLLSCSHIGSAAISWECIENAQERMSALKWLHVGDLIEGILPDDPRFAAPEWDGTVLNEMQEAQKFLKANRKNAIGLIKGNHEQAASKRMGDVSGFMATEAKVPYLGEVAFIRFLCPSGELVAFAAHGSTSMGGRAGEPERIRANRQIKLRTLFRAFSADLFMCGHFHRTIITPPVMVYKLALDGAREKRLPVPERPGWYCAAPSMFKTYSSEVSEGNYAQRSLYPPTGIGWTEIDIDRAGQIIQTRRIRSKGETVETILPEIIEL